MKKYQIILADPPWKYQLFSDKPPCSRKVDEDYYEVMDLLDMAQLPIKDIKRIKVGSTDYDFQSGFQEPHAHAGISATGIWLSLNFSIAQS